MTIGYTTGEYDLFHIGHLTLLKNAKGLCDKLIVGVTVDELVLYKGKKAMIPYSDRAEIVRSVKYVDAVVPQYDMDKLSACRTTRSTPRAMRGSPTTAVSWLTQRLRQARWSVRCGFSSCRAAPRSLRPRFSMRGRSAAWTARLPLRY